MRAYFSRKKPFYLMSQNEVGDSDGFDAYPVVVEPDVLLLCQTMRNIVKAMEDAFNDMPAPEESAQKEADLLDELIRDNIRENS